ncbi:hypothetical protein GCM10027431_10810 [Lysobacter rhizosphaerae]
MEREDGLAQPWIKAKQRDDVHNHAEDKADSRKNEYGFDQVSHGCLTPELGRAAKRLRLE